MYETASSVDVGISQDLLERRGLLATPCWTMRTPSCAARCAVAPGRSRGQQAHGQAGALRPDDRRPVLDVEALGLAAVGVHRHDAVGQHAVDVEEQQPDAPRPLLDGHALSGRPSDHLRPPEIVQVHDSLDAPAASTTTTRRDLARFHDLQRFDREQPPIDGDRLPRHHLAGRQRQHVRRPRSSAGAGRRR